MTDDTLAFHSDGTTLEDGASSYTSDNVVTLTEGADIMGGYARASLRNLKTSTSTATVRLLVEGSNDNSTFYPVSYSDDVIAVTTTEQNVQVAAPINSRFKYFRTKIEASANTTDFYWECYWSQTRYA